MSTSTWSGSGRTLEIGADIGQASLGGAHVTRAVHDEALRQERDAGHRRLTRGHWCSLTFCDRDERLVVGPDVVRRCTSNENSLAPPCLGPRSAPIAPVTAE